MIGDNLEERLITGDISPLAAIGEIVKIMVEAEESQK